MRVLVDVFFAGDQGALFLEQGDDGLIGFEDMFSGEEVEAGFTGEAAEVIDWREQSEVIFSTGVIVIGAVSGGEVDGAGAGFGGDEEAGDDGGGAWEERMGGGLAFQAGSF